MRMKYQLSNLSKPQRAMIEYLLLEEMSKQTWYAIVYMNFWKTQGLVAIQ